MAMDGINNLIAVTQMKSSNANDEAMTPPPPPPPPKPASFLTDGAIIGSISSVWSFLQTPKPLESADRLGNFEIQNLMSNYNQAETLASSVQKKKDDTASGILSKI